MLRKRLGDTAGRAAAVDDDPTVVARGRAAADPAGTDEGGAGNARPPAPEVVATVLRFGDAAANPLEPFVAAVDPAAAVRCAFALLVVAEAATFRSFAA